MNSPEDFEEEIEDDESEDNQGPDYWYCNVCGYSCVERPAWGGQCPRCGPVMEEGYY
jgi:rubrerythrin